MADDKAKIDWTMLEAAVAEPAPLDGASPGVLPASSPAPVPPADKPTGKSVAKIAFTCPNGHRVIAAATLAGQRGKCSKCGAAVRIPGETAGQARSAPAGRGAAKPSGPEPVFDGGKPEEHEAAGDSDEARRAFEQVGAPSDPHADSQEGLFSGLGTTGDSHSSGTDFVELSQQLSHSFHETAPPVVEPAGPEPPDIGQPDASSSPNPTAALVARLFQEMEHGGIVEVHVTGGSVILPEFYEPRWSVGSHGLFASRAADGTVTLTAVAWDSIQKIVVRQVEGLPDGMFE